MTTSRWMMRLVLLPEWHKILLSAQINNRPACDVIRQMDTPNTLFYCDPPYVTRTRTSSRVYNHEMTDAQHNELVECLLGTCGAVAVSGYPSDIYSRLDESGWLRDEFRVTLSSVNKNRSGCADRTEVLWRNPRCVEMLASEEQCHETE